MSVPTSLDTLTSGLSSIARIPAGITVRDNVVAENASGDGCTRARLVTLYDVENDARCRMVRECISELDLIVERVVPCGKGSRVWETDEGGLGRFQDASADILPRLVVMEESSSEDRVLQGVDDIVAYLENTFTTDSGDTDADADIIVPLWRSYIATALRFGRGSTVSPAATTSSPSYKPVVLYSYEGNQFCRLVREVLTELDLPFELRSAGKGSPRRAELAKRSGGSTQCPYLIDPNTDTQMSESGDIIAYLYKTYARWTPPVEILRFLSNVFLPPLKPLYAELAPLQAGEDFDAEAATEQIRTEVLSAPLVIYTYQLSPFCSEATELLTRLGVAFVEFSLGQEWIPGLLQEPAKRAALGQMTGQTSLPHIFVNGESIGGLFDGTPGLMPSLEDGSFWERYNANTNDERRIE